jgi:alkylation response protein AidB-like acyl-CoA dehydrogenase
VVSWDLAKNGREAADKRIAWEEKNHFFWISGLSELLGEYEANRGSYPDLESFFPEIKQFFVEYAAHAEERIGRIKSRWEEETRKMASRTPKIVSLLPAAAEAADLRPGYPPAAGGRGRSAGHTPTWKTVPWKRFG